MENIAPIRIQIISIVASLGFLLYIGRLVIRGKLRAEYSIVWIISSLALIIFSLWRPGIDVVGHLLGVYAGINLAFAGMIFMILVYLLHLSIVASRLQEQNKELAQQIALLKERLGRK